MLSSSLCGWYPTSVLSLGELWLGSCRILVITCFLRQNPRILCISLWRMKIERSAPIWTLLWNLTHNKTSDTLVVGCWDGTISFYNLSGKQVGEDKYLGYNPCSITYYGGKFLCIGGTNKQVLFYTKEGVKLTTLCETADLVWTVRSHPKNDYVVLGSNDGSISMLQLVFSTVHGLHLERYAFRDSLTDVVIQNLVSNEKVRIKCHDYVRKIAVYQERAAVQLSNGIVIYELGHGDTQESYNVCAQIKGSLDCNLLVLTSEHIIFCQETKLQLYTFFGDKEREWVLDSAIRYIKVCGGPRGGEQLLAGLKSGSIVRIWINNNFPLCIYSHTSAIRCLDFSAQKSQLAAVDESGNVFVYDLKRKEIVFQEKFASSVAWNTQMEEMLCYAGSGTLNIKTATFPVYRQKFQGYVVGFHGSKLFCLYQFSIQTIDVPLSWSMKHYIETGEHEDAYRVACLGVTEADWRLLGLESMQAQLWSIAHACFSRLQDVCFLDLLDQIEKGKISTQNKPALLATIHAYQGRFEEAAQLYCEAGQLQKAMEMFADLHMFDEAKDLAEKNHDADNKSQYKVQEIIQRQAEWTEEKKDHATAADMYLIAGQPEKALALVAEHGPPSKLIEVARRLKKEDSQELSLCATLMKHHGLHTHALETYTKLGDFRSVLSMHLDMQKWEDAFAIKALHPELEMNVCSPYADWLVTQDQYDNACLAYKQAGQPESSKHLLKQLINNAVNEKRFKDASFLSLKLASEVLNLCTQASCGDQTPSNSGHTEYTNLWRQAEIYYAYSFIDQSINEPFRMSTPETLFNITLFLLGRVTKQSPVGISLVNVLVTLAKQAEHLGCYKAARSGYGRLQVLQVPASWRDKLDVAALAVRALAAVSDESSPRLECPCCYCCASPLPVLSSSWRDACGFCSQPVIRSFTSFDQLPIVEFFLEDNITHDNATKLLKVRPFNGNSMSPGESIQHKAESNPAHWRATLQRLFLISNSRSKPGQLRANENTLSNLQVRQIIIENSPGVKQQRYFYVIDPSLEIYQCSSCRHFFDQEEWDVAVLKEGFCPFCRSSGPASPTWTFPGSKDSSGEPT